MGQAAGSDAEATIVALYDELMAAWTAGDAVRYGSCFTSDCDYVSYDGTWTRGRQRVTDAHDQLFRGVLRGSALVGGVESVRMIAADVAVVHATGSVRMPWRRRLPRRRRSRQTLVAVRAEAGWRFTALHNGRVRPVRIPEPDSLVARASQLLAAGATVWRSGGRTASHRLQGRRTGTCPSAPGR